jgi:Na+/H+ antiporter NhaC
MAGPALGQEASVDVPDLILSGVGFDVTASVDAAPSDSALAVRVDGQPYAMTYAPEADTWTAEEVIVPSGGTVSVEVVQNGAVLAQATTRAIPGWLSILPPLLAIAMALAFKRVIPALFLGVWIGAWIAVGLTMGGLFWGLLDAFEVYVLTALANEDHAAIILFSLMIGGMVGIISKNGGTFGVVERIVGWANTPKRGQVATGVMGLGIFFDDYANTLVVGNTMRPVTDRLRISREKLAYIVDSTAAPVACLAFVTTWIGYEVGLVGTAVANLDGFNESAYSIFLNSIPYSFYPLLALFFVFAVANSRRDFGPMYRAEKRARTTGKVLSPNAKVDEAADEGKELAPDDSTPRRAFNAVIPVMALVVSVLGGLYYTGAEAVGDNAPLREVIGAANSYQALMWGSLIGVLVAAVLSVGQRLLTLEETVEAWYSGLKSMLFAMVILVLAWALSEITAVLHTADYLTSILGEALPPGTVPAIIFVLAAATAFATGSSWGTMGILMPLVVPLTWAVLVANGMDSPSHYHIMYSAVSCVLAGAVWGDHCSPISDTTILSSMASGCDHIDHVRTQLPYAMSVGLVALLLGTLPAGFGLPWWVSLLVGAALLSITLRLLGTPVEMHDVPPPEMEETPSVASTAAETAET